MSTTTGLGTRTTVTGWIDTVIGRVTSYRLVTIVLAVIAVWALGASLLGQLPYEPLELLGSVVVAVASTALASVLVARIMRANAHLESSIITGLLLFFLFWPSLAVVDLGTLALAGVVAGASKYLLAWRGRHIMNPAAVGAMVVTLLPVVGLTQLVGAVWWVASAAMLPVVLAGAVLVLYRVRRLAMGATFVLVAAGLLLVRLTVTGQPLADAVGTVFTSYPVLFLAGFMLTEPLTMAPRRWQQIAVAAIVGALFAAVGLVAVGAVYLSFEMALVIGNLVAFAMGQRRGIRLDFVARRELTPTASEFSFRPRSPVRFRAGQYVELEVPHRRRDARGSRRVFTIASAPADADQLAVALRMPERSSSFKAALAQLEPGSALTATAVGGDFLLPRDLSRPVLLVAGGIGITPFVSQLVDDRLAGRDRNAVLVYAVSSVAELPYRDVLARDRVLVICPTEPDGLPAAWQWVGDGPLSAELLRMWVPDAAARVAYTSGSPAFVADSVASLRQVGVRRVRRDYFAGY
ncbi:FAD-dependent oxidoreductase [Marisediminicola senii]|uniref:FAD-dependent oxidoreductase n=1 Tax=Marisediminicola senii TaxID=2711233 RepID=UPI0013EC42D1|nr:oxidoreductase [Marisediminicola senii]